MATAVVDNKIYVIGGFDQTTLFNVVEEYDPATDTWRNGFAPMPTTRYGMRGIEVKGVIYVMGGLIFLGTTSTRSKPMIHEPIHGRRKPPCLPHGSASVSQKLRVRFMP